MRKLIGLLMLLPLAMLLTAGCAGPHPVRRATVGSAKAVGKGTVWVAKKTGQGVVYVTKAGTNAVKSIGKDPVADPETLVHVGDKPLHDGTANLVEQEVAERESGEFLDAPVTRTAERPVSTRSSGTSTSNDNGGWTTKGAADDGMLATDDPGDLAMSSGGSRGGTTTISTANGEIRHDLPELDIDATLTAAEGEIDQDKVALPGAFLGTLNKEVGLAPGIRPATGVGLRALGHPMGRGPGLSKTAAPQPPGARIYLTGLSPIVWHDGAFRASSG